MPVSRQGTGSTGGEKFERVKHAIARYRAEFPENKTSARWSSHWAQRGTTPFDIRCDYPIGAGEANTPAGMYAYYRRLVNSTRNTSSGGRYAILGLPNASWRDFSTRVPVAGQTTLSDAARWQHVYEILRTTSPVDYQQDGEPMELLAAWAGNERTSNEGSS